MICVKCFREVWGDVQGHRERCTGRAPAPRRSYGSRQGSEYVRHHNILDDTNPDTVAGDLLSNIDHDTAEERQRRAEEFDY
jgi:hypothetical protein